MNDFESFDPRCWAEKGLTFTLSVRHLAKLRTEKRPSLKSNFIFAVTAAAISFSVQNVQAEPSQAVLNWLTPIAVINGVLDRDTVPVGYWQKLASAMKSAPLLLDDDNSMDPDSIL